MVTDECVDISVTFRRRPHKLPYSSQNVSSAVTPVSSVQINQPFHHFSGVHTQRRHPKLGLRCWARPELCVNVSAPHRSAWPVNHSSRESSGRWEWLIVSGLIDVGRSLPFMSGADPAASPCVESPPPDQPPTRGRGGVMEGGGGVKETRERGRGSPLRVD